MSLRIALLGAEHWHLPLYAAAFAEVGARVVALSHEGAADKAFALFPDARRHVDDAALLDQEAIDFAFVFGHHRRMLDRCRDLVRRRIAFSVEKPVTLDVDALSRLRDDATVGGVFISVALPYRHSRVGEIFESAPGAPLHLGIRNIAGPVQRYLKNANPWMWQRAEALGGCMVNLAPHFIDLAHWIAKSPVETVQGTRLRFTPSCEVEEFGTVTITYASGFVAHIECGYTFPSTVEYSVDENREFYISMATTEEYLTASHDVLRRISRIGAEGGRDAMFRAGTREAPVDLQTDHFFRPYTVDALGRFRNKLPPLVGLDALIAVDDVLSRWDAAAPWAGAGGGRGFGAAPAA